jgi:membrane protease YdiL (CAAX protease family)
LGDVALGFAVWFAGSSVAATIYVETTGERLSDAPLPALLLLQLPVWVGLLGVPLWAVHTKGNGVRRDLGLSSRLLDAPLGLAIGVATQVVVVNAIYFVIFRLTDISPEDVEAPARSLSDRADGGLAVFLLVLLVVVGSPIAEEVFFRGLFLRSLHKRGLGAVAAVVVSSVIFGLSHLQLVQLPALVAFGLVAAYLAERTGRLGPSIWAHVGFNAITVVVLLS